MTTPTIAQRLVELCRQGQFDQAYQELFAENAVSAEPARYNVPPAEGHTALFEKGKKWAEDMIG